MNEENNNNGSFIKGLFTGIFITAVVCLMVIVGLFGTAIITSLKSSVTGTVNAGDDATSKLSTLEEIIDQYYLFDYTDDDLADGLYKGLLEGLGDPYSVYYTAEEYDALMESSSGYYSGIGVVVQLDTDTGAIKVVRPFEGSPGEEAGLQTDDIIYTVEGTEVTGMDLSSAVALIKGEEGTKVTLGILRDGELFDVEVERRQIETTTVSSKMMDNNIGYIYITEWDEVTYSQFMKAYNTLISEGMESLVIDLRDNPGGLLSSVTDILDEFLGEDIMVYTEDKNGNRENYTSDAAHSIADIPMAVLINGNSASASEIFAGAIKDYELGTLIGTTSYGKGIVQRIIPLNDGSAVKITISDYYTPDGNNIHGIGIEPDIEVEYDSETENDEQLDRAIEELTK